MYNVITTADQGDCFFDSIYRATKNVDDLHAPKNTYVSQVHEFRKEIAAGVNGNKLVERNIKELYNLFSQKDLNNIRDKFYLSKNGKKPMSKDNEDTIFQTMITVIFKMYPETELTYDEKEQIFTNYLSLLYRFFPDVSSPDSKEFNDFAGKYTELYNKGNRDIYEPLETQYTELSKLIQPSVILPSVPPVPPAPVEQPKPKAKPKLKIVNEPVVQPVAQPVVQPVVQPVAEIKTSNKVFVPSDTDPVVATIIGIYNSSDTIQDKKAKLDKFKKPQLEAAWDIIAKVVPDLRHPAPKKNIGDYVNCLANDPDHTCNSARKETKKKGGSKSNKYTRNKKI
jgi:hypothetical protein